MTIYVCTCSTCGKSFACNNPMDSDCGDHGVPRKGCVPVESVVGYPEVDLDDSDYDRL